MRIFGKLLLFIASLLILIYASIPLWAGYMLAKQLPENWQLDNFDTQYPGFIGVKVNQLQLSGLAENSGITLSFDNAHFYYDPKQLEIDTLKLDIVLQETPDASINLNDLSIPVLSIPQNIPNLQIETVNINIKKLSQNLLKLQLSKLELSSNSQEVYLVRSTVKFNQEDNLSGKLKAALNPQTIHVKVNLANTGNSLPWLSMEFEQQLLNNNSTLMINFDSAHTDSQWLSTFIASSTDNLIKSASGKASIDAGFAGQETHKLTSLAVDSDQLSAVLEDAEVWVDTSILARGNDSEISLRFIRDSELYYSNKNAVIPQWLELIPGLQLTEKDSDGTINTKIANNSSLSFPSAQSHIFSFSGDAEISIETATSEIKLSANDLVAEINQDFNLNSITTAGLFNLSWLQKSVFIYAVENINLEAKSGTINFLGPAEINNLNFSFPEALAVTANLNNMQLGIKSADDTDTIITADTTSLNTDIYTSNEQFITTGKAQLLNTKISPLGISTAETMLEWTDLIPEDLSGSLSIRSNDFSLQNDAGYWSGLDLELESQLLENSEISGAGTVLIYTGPIIPISFSGNIDTARWEINIQESKFESSKLPGIFNLLQLDMPAELKFTEGLLSVKGEIQLAAEISAKLDIEGNEVGASLLKSSLSGADFSGSLLYGDSLELSSPLTLERVNLAAGLSLANISTQVNLLNDGAIRFGEFSADLFSGQLHTQKIQIINSNQVISMLSFSQLDLQQLMEFADFDGLTGTGELNIKLPINSDAVGLVIEDGTFASNGPGHLSYSQAGVPSSNIGLQALENFHYQKLSGNIEYKSDGSYKMAIKLEGSNPDLYDGYPIVFTLNLNGVLPELFNALFISGNFEEAILQQVQSEKIQTEPSADIQ